MAKDFSKSFYNKKAWKRTAQAYREGKAYICERCGAPNCRQVHHKIKLTPENIDNPDVSLGWNNLELLCDICHQQEHHQKYSATVEGYKFCEETGRLIKDTPHKKPPYPTS